MTEPITYSLDDLSRLTGLTPRTIRYYIQMELVDCPEGGRKNAHYLAKHLEALLTIQRLSAEGFSLERIREKMQLGTETKSLDTLKPGSIDVITHIHIASGIELTVNPRLLGMDSNSL